MHIHLQALLTADDYVNAQILHVGKRYPILLFLISSDLLLNMFPRRWFASEADYESLKEVLQKQIGEPGKPRKRG